MWLRFYPLKHQIVPQVLQQHTQQQLLFIFIKLTYQVEKPLIKGIFIIS